MISIIREDLGERIRDAEDLIELIGEVSNAKKSINKVAIAKSALFLVLYNIVESTVLMAFEEVHEKLNHFSFSELSPKLQELYSEYYFKDKKPRAVTKLLKGTVESEIKFPNIEEYLRRINLFSGNLDAREINSILTKYGIGNLTNESRKYLVVIKSKRNKLAHGESSFKESGREFTSKELSLFKVSVSESMGNLINAVESYIVNERYLVENSL